MLRRVIPLTLLVALVASCGVTSSNAATANSASISESNVRNELKIIRGNKAYRDVMEQQYQLHVAGETTGTFDSAFAAQVLSVDIYYSLIEQRLAKEHKSPNAADLRTATKTLDQNLQTLGDAAAKSFPQAYKNTLVKQYALIDVAQRVAAEDYVKNLKVACVSHILVDTKDKADDLKRQLAAGADFAALAKANSTDPGSKDQGGDLGCKPKGAYVAEFDAAAFSLPVGTVSEPVKTQFGYHLILVRERRAARSGEVAADVSQQAFNDFMLDVVCRNGKVHVNPSYGTWDTTACKDQSGLGRVTPPIDPTPPPTNPTPPSSAP